MLRYAARRFLYAIFVVAGVVTLVFVILRLLPGDTAYLMAGPSATQAEVDQLRAVLGLDQPLHVQFGIFLRGLLGGDFGNSAYYSGASALGLVLERLPATLQLVAPALGLAVTAALVLGTLAAVYRGSWLDDATSAVALVGQAAPEFWIGPLLIMVFARNLNWLPTSGQGGLNHMALPVITLALPLFAVSMRLVRSGLLDTLTQEYVKTARAKGLRERTVLMRHVFRNMLIPVVTFIGLQLGHLLSGSVVVEIVFAWPGVGRLLVDSLANRDYAVTQIGVIVFAGLFILVNLGIDLLYGVIDPRIDYA